ncbi:hypothetical protein [Brevibacillus reuszeri]|uniref:hypothetical protein n=1 Tax=Brevibacillus reuszeri TaxID=54915 RepID=UPI0013DE7D2E|nr:hypothetical protein [Brevibacillus reuszeri]
MHRRWKARCIPIIQPEYKYQLGFGYNSDVRLITKGGMTATGSLVLVAVDE